MSSKSNTAQKIPADIALVVFGTDRRKKLHASRFGADTAQSAQEAAGAMGMRALRIVSDEQREVASKLPKGSVSAKGRAVVPFVRPALYNKLLAVAGTEGAPPAPSVPTSTPVDASKKPPAPTDGKPGSPGGWDGLTTGAVVLAFSHDESSWFEAIVQNILDGGVLTLKWRDWPDLPKFNRKLVQVALLHPQMVKPC